jgi:archaetidylinositol phosphate synthase
VSRGARVLRIPCQEAHVATPSPLVRQQPAGVHVRQHGSLLAEAEKRALVWIAERLPARVNSDHLSALGLLSIVGAGLAFWLSASAPTVGLPLVVACLALNWFGDSLDGTLARVRNRQRPRYGFYVDHVIDVAGTTCLLGGLASSGYMSPLIAGTVLVAWLLVAAESFLATHARGVFHLSFVGVGPTEMRILLAIGALWLLRGGWVAPFGLEPVRLFDVGGVMAAAGLAVAFVSSAVANTRALYREETWWR